MLGDIKHEWQKYKVISILKNLKKRGSLNVRPDIDRRTISQLDLKKQDVSMWTI